MERSDAKKRALENYVPVKDRLKEFRNEHGINLSLESEIIYQDDNSCTFKATIKEISTGNIIAIGHSHEKISDNPHVNSTSMVENCETSAWGRALANLGMQIDKGIASKEEMKKANTPKGYTGTKEEQQRLFSILRSMGINEDELATKIHRSLIENKIFNDTLSLTRFVKDFNHK